MNSVLKFLGKLAVWLRISSAVVETTKEAVKAEKKS